MTYSFLYVILQMLFDNIAQWQSENIVTMGKDVKMQDYLYSVIGFIAIAVQLIINFNAFEGDIQKSLAMGMDAHVAKPIDVNTLFETMKGLVKPEV